MTLQDQLKQKILEFGGLEKIVDDLREEGKRAPVSRKIIFRGTIWYLWLLHRKKMNIVDYALSHQNVTHFLIRYFHKWGKIRKSESMTFLSELLRFKMEYVEKVRRIA